MKKQKIICITGPTASGKTALAIKLAQHLDTEIISADSMQIYKNLSIGTAKPTENEQKQIKHHMLDICEISENFSVADYVEKAGSIIKVLSKKNKIPIIAGGTGLYIDSLLNNTDFKQAETTGKEREKLEILLEEKGSIHLHNLLKEIDENAAKQIHPNNTGKIIRALEIYYETGKTKTQYTENSKRESPHDPIIIGLNTEREILYERINKRVDEMIQNGLIKEAEWLYKNNPSKTVLQAIGYKELKPYIDNEMPLEEAAEILKMQTRRYAKRQLTWFNKNPQIQWLDFMKNDLFEKAVKIIKGKINT